MQQYNWITEEYETSNGIEIGLSNIAKRNLKIKFGENQQPLLLKKIEIGDENKYEALLVYQIQEDPKSLHQSLGIISSIGAYYPFKEIQKLRILFEKKGVKIDDIMETIINAYKQQAELIAAEQN